MRWLTLLLLVLVQCSSDPAADPIADRVCDPGKQTSCACPGGTQGAQSCNADGSGFNECQCETGGSSGSAGSGGLSGSGGSGGGLSGASGAAGSSATAGTAGTGGISGSAGEAGMAGASGTAGVAGSGGIAGTGGSADDCHTDDSNENTIVGDVGDSQYCCSEQYAPSAVGDLSCEPQNGPDDLLHNLAGEICAACGGQNVFALQCFDETTAPFNDCVLVPWAVIGTSVTGVFACCPQTQCVQRESGPGVCQVQNMIGSSVVSCPYGIDKPAPECMHYPSNIDPNQYCCP